MATFPERFSELDDDMHKHFKPCMKRPIVIKATPIFMPFRVKTLEGDYKQGKPGDYLMCGINGELYICDAEIFERSYDFVSGG